MNRYSTIMIVCGFGGALGFALELVYFNDNETISSAWRIVATSVVALLLLTALGAGLLGSRKRIR